MKNNIAKYPSFSEYDFIRLYCALNVKNEKSPLLIHHELEKKLYKFYDIPGFKILFEDICPKKNYVNDEKSYLFLTTAFQTAQTFGLLISIKEVGEIMSLITCDMNQADQIIANYNSEIVSAMAALFNLLFKNSSNNEIHYNEENFEAVRKPCDVKITEESRKILVKSLLK